MRTKQKGGRAKPGFILIVLSVLLLVSVAALYPMFSRDTGPRAPPSSGTDSTHSSTSHAVSGSGVITATATNSLVPGGTTSASKTLSSSVTAASGSSSLNGVVQILLPPGVGDNESMNFQPNKIRVVVGINNTIVWNDTDYVQHTVKSVSIPSGAKSWDSGILNQGQTYTITLTTPGTYGYVCTIHPDWMRGSIQVVG